MFKWIQQFLSVDSVIKNAVVKCYGVLTFYVNKLQWKMLTRGYKNIKLIWILFSTSSIFYEYITFLKIMFLDTEAINNVS